MNVSEFFETQCEKHDKSTILSHAPNGSTIIYVSNAEVDPMTALMVAALEIAMKRAETGHVFQNDNVKVVRNKIVTTPAYAFLWTCTAPDGSVHSGHAATEREASMKMAEIMLSRLPE